MSLVDLGEDIESEYGDLPDELDVVLDSETKNELALLEAALDPDDPGDLVRRAVHLLFQQTVDTGKLDFHLRRTYDCTYDEYLAGMTYESMTGNGYEYPERDDDRRYQF